MNKSIRRHIFRYGFVYLLLIVLSIALWTWLVPAKVRYKANEKVGIFVGVKSGDESLFTSVIEKEEIETIKQINVYTSDPSYSLFGTMISSVGQHSCDFFLLPIGYFDKNIISSLCLEIDESLLKETFGDKYDCYSLDSKTYGLKLFKEDGSLFLNDFISYEDELSKEYILVFNKTSMNNMSLHKDNNGETDNGVKAARALLNYEKE